MPGDGFQEHSGVGHIMSEWTDLIQRAGEGDQSISGHPTISRLKTDNAAKTGGLADRSAGITSQCERRFTRSHSGCGAAARASRDPLEVPRIASDLVGAVFRRRAHSEL